MKSADIQAASVVLSVLELCAAVGQSDTQGEQLRSGLGAPWIAYVESTEQGIPVVQPRCYIGMNKHCCCPPVQQASYLADVPQVEVRPAAQIVYVTPHAECLIQLISNVPHHRNRPDLAVSNMDMGDVNL